MRAHTTLRTAFRFGMMMAVATGMSVVASEAHADVTGPSGGAGNSSTGTAALKYERNKGMGTTIDTGFIGPEVAQVKALVSLDPVKDGGPLFTVEMAKGAVVEATWANDKKITLKAANGSQQDGIVKVRHTISPSLIAKIKIPVINQIVELKFDATKYVNKLPGARFAYDSRAQQAFAPWGFTAVDTKLNSPDLNNSVLFSMPLDAFDDILDPEKWEGTIGIKAASKPTFSYKTTQVLLSGATTPVTATEGAVVDAIDGDYMEVMAQVGGEMKVAGSIEIRPYLQLSKALGYNFSTNIEIPVYSASYKSQAADEKVEFQSALVHIPLPNVHVPTAGVDLGTVKAGGSAKKTITIENSGEMAASMTFKSSDPSVQVPSGSITIASKGKYELQVQASPSNAGPALSEVTVVSNDPDAPEQMFKVGMNGADVGPTGEEDGDLPGSPPSVEEGCGCKTAGGSTTSNGGYMGLGLMALGAVIVYRRRKATKA